MAEANQAKTYPAKTEFIMLGHRKQIVKADSENYELNLGVVALIVPLYVLILALCVRCSRVSYDPFCTEVI